MTTDLSPDELRRYSRHLTLPEFGIEGQRRLKNSSVLVVGAGGLGSPVAMYLAAAGVGRIGIVDDDVVDESNLQRQLLHGASDVGRRKVDSAADRLREINPLILIETHNTRLAAENALEIIDAYDLVADGADNFATRYLVNDACVLAGKPNVYASIFRFEGQVSVFNYAGGPCYRCIFEAPPPAGTVPSCEEGGVLGVLPGIVGTIQAAEAIKVLTGIGVPLARKLMVFDALTMQFRTIKIERNPQCMVCGDQPALKSLEEYDVFCGMNNGHPTETTMNDKNAAPEITVAEFKEMRDRGEEPFLLDVRRQHEYDFANIGGHLIPLDELPDRLGEIDRHRDEFFVVYCRSGARSGRAVEFLREKGFSKPMNLKGGILAWSREIDPSVPTY